MNMSKTTRWIIVIASVSAIGLLAWRPWESSRLAVTTPQASDRAVGTDEPPSTSAAEKHRLDQQRAAAYELQAKREWCAAHSAWEALVGNPAADVSLRHEAQQNVDLLRPLCSASSPSGDDRYVDKLDLEAELQKRPLESRPRKPPTDELLAFYAPGKKVLSECNLQMTGSGENRNWLVKGEAHFAYQYRIAIETSVVANDGASVVFEQKFLEVVQNLANSREELQLNVPEMPLLAAVGSELERHFLDQIPQYRMVKRLAEITQVADPSLKSALTFFHGQLKRYGVPLTDTADVQIAARIDELAGMRLKSRYVPGLGVTFIEVLEGKRMDQDDLAQLAYNSSLLMDYFVSEAATREVGQTWELRTQDIGGLVNLRYDVQMDGKLFLRRDNDVQKDGNPLQVLTVTGGEAAVSSRVEGAQREGNITVAAGWLRYDPGRRFVQAAELDWKAGLNWTSRNSLLFGTEKIRNLRMQTAYRAWIPNQP